MKKSKYLSELPQYHFDRAEFVTTFRSIFSDDELCDLEIDCQTCRCLDKFLLHYSEGEYYIIHKPSGTIINWYKHLGRTNTCNKEGFGLTDLQELLKELYEELKDTKH